MNRNFRRFLVATILLLGACGGNPPTIQITAPTNGLVVNNGNRSIAVTGTGSDLGSVQVKLNGVAIPAADVSVAGGGFTATITLGNNANTIEAVANNKAGSAKSTPITVVYPFITLSTFQSASVVVGQTSFSDNAGPAAAATTIKAPGGRALVHEGRLYLPDSGHSRVLVYEQVPASNGAEAVMVLGQQDLAQSVTGATDSRWTQPTTVVAEAGRLLVNDGSNNRVLIFDAIPSVSGAAADRVVGADDFEPVQSGCAADRLNTPQSIFAVDGKLLVADTENNRVLVWNSIPTTNGAPADLVLGQAAFDQCEFNRGDSANAGTMHYPWDVWSDGTRLLVADSNNNRILVWNTFPTVNGQAADLAVGQASLTEKSSSELWESPMFPRSVTSNGNQLFVADTGKKRVLIWDTFPTGNGAAADKILGQSDFEHKVANDDDQNGEIDGSPTARTLDSPRGVVVRGNQLFVTDTNNNRVLIFNGQ